MEQAQKEEAALWNTPIPTNAVKGHNGLSIFKFARFANEEMFDPPTGEPMKEPTDKAADNFLSRYKPPEQRFFIPKNWCSLAILDFDYALCIVCKTHTKKLLHLSYEHALNHEMVLEFLLYRKHSDCDKLSTVFDDEDSQQEMRSHIVTV